MGIWVVVRQGANGVGDIETHDEGKGIQKRAA